jgi:prepilin-type processing-associated H-X9-DG protein
LLVIAIIAVVIGLLLPAVQSAREAARRVQCVNNVKQMGLALHNDHDALSVFPPGYIAAIPFKDGETDTSPGWSWASMILPQLDQSPLFSSINFLVPVHAQANTTGTQVSLNVFLCPSDLIPGRTFAVTDGFGNTVATVAPTSYGACAGKDAAGVALGLNNDGSGNGLFFAGLDDPSSFHPGGANALFGDGSVHFLKNVTSDAGTNPDGSTRYTPSSPIVQANHGSSTCTTPRHRFVARPYSNWEMWATLTPPWRMASPRRCATPIRWFVATPCWRSPSLKNRATQSWPD